MNNSLLNTSLTNGTINKKNIVDNDNDFFILFIEFITNHHNKFVLIFYILLVIFIMELLLIFYLHKKKLTIWNLCSDNCFEKRINRKRNLSIQMGRLSHSIEIK